MSTKRGPDIREPTHEQVYQFVQQHSRPFVTTPEVAEQFNSVSGRTVRKRLNHLAETGRIEVREVGGNSKVWFLPSQSD